MTSLAAYRRRQILLEIASSIPWFAAFVGLPVLVGLAVAGNEPPPRRAAPPPDLEISAAATQDVISALRVCPVLLHDVQEAFADGRLVASEGRMISARRRVLSADPVTAPACVPETTSAGGRPRAGSSTAPPPTATGSRRAWSRAS